MNWFKKSGFSVAELMVSMGIIGFVITIATDHYQVAKIKAARTEAKVTIRYVATGLEAYLAENETYIVNNFGATLDSTKKTLNVGAQSCPAVEDFYVNYTSPLEYPPLGLAVGDCNQLRYRYQAIVSQPSAAEALRFSIVAIQGHESSDAAGDPIWAASECPQSWNCIDTLMYQSTDDVLAVTSDIIASFALPPSGGGGRGR